MTFALRSNVKSSAHHFVGQKMGHHAPVIDFDERSLRLQQKNRTGRGHNSRRRHAPASYWTQGTGLSDSKSHVIMPERLSENMLDRITPTKKVTVGIEIKGMFWFLNS